MLTALAFGMVVVFMLLIMTKRLSALTALILVPITFGIIGGFTSGLGAMMLAGITKLAPTGVMLMFAILYFAVMIDSGLFDPFVRAIVRIVHGDPMKIVVGTAVLALLVSLDGDGSTTYMITTAAMLPLYRRLGIRPLILACITMMSGGVMNILPWGGPTARVASALGVDSSEIFVPLIPAMIAGAAWTLYVAWRLGMHERVRLAAVVGTLTDDRLLDAATSHPLRGRPGRLWLNAALTAALMTALVLGVMPLPVLFMIGFAVAMLLNFPTIEEQKTLLGTHAGNVLAVVGMIFAAGIFTGILAGTKMIDAMADSVIKIIPAALGPYMSVVTALLSIPFTFFISNDAFYFGVLPILAKAGHVYGIAASEMGRASLIGQPVHLLSPLVPSTYLLVGLVDVPFDEHQRYTIKWAFMTAMVMLVAGLFTSAFPLAGRLVAP